MEFLVQLFRALANRSRIRMLRLLAVLSEVNVSGLARATTLEISLVSSHLKILAAAGLVWRRRSGRVVWYRLAEHAGNPVTATTLGLLTRVFRHVPHTNPKQVAAGDQADSAVRSDAALFASFTAFTHPRRLQIIRHLAREGAASPRELSAHLSMSRNACARHLDKLQRRGVVRQTGSRRRPAYALTNGRGHVLRAVLRAVRDFVA